MDSVPQATSGRRAPVARLDVARDDLSGALVFLFAVRWAAWVVPLVLVITDTPPAEATQHEPLLLVLTFIQNLAVTLYVGFIRPRLTRSAGEGWWWRYDLVALALVDLVVVMVVLAASGGWRSPYYEFALSSLLVPTFLLGWRESALVVGAFIVAYVAIISVAGPGTDAGWLGSEQQNFIGALVSPILVALVMQLARHLVQQRQEALAAFAEATVLYNLAQAVAASRDATALVSAVARAVQETKRFSAMSIVSKSLSGDVWPVAGFGGGEKDGLHVALSDVEAIAGARAATALSVESGDGERVWALPVLADERLWGAVAFAKGGTALRPGDVRLMEATGYHLSSGLTRLSLEEQRHHLAAQEERARIAREIHDGIAQSVYMLSLNLEKAAELAGGETELGERLERLLGLARETLLEVRYYIFDLKPLLEGAASITETIRNQTIEFTAVSGLPVQFEVEGQEGPVPVVLAGSLYRITQEALANVYRHAHATSVDVRLRFQPEGVALAVTDDGRGLPAEDERADGRGLRNMRERARQLRGTVEISNANGGGVRMRVELPLTGAEIA